VTRAMKLVIPVIVIAAVAAFWYLALAPKREEMTKLDADIATRQAQLAQAEQQAAGYEKAKANYRKNYTTLARLGKAVPGDDDVRSLLVQLDATAKRSKIEFRSLTLAGGSAAPGATAKAATGSLAPAPGTVPVGSAGFSAIPFTFTFSGNYFRLSDFLNRLEHFVSVQNSKIDVTGRLLLLGSIAVTPETGETAATGSLQAQIGAAAYLLPATQPVPGASTPATGAAPGAAPASGGSTPPPTTATITGVR
jgi:hypothetical protein